jgi:hypothetical protein
MAVKNQPVVADLGSEEVTLTRKQLNNLLDAFDALITASQAADFATFKTDAAAIDLSALRKIVATHELPTPPMFPTKG